MKGTTGVGSNPWKLENATALGLVVWTLSGSGSQGSRLNHHHPLLSLDCRIPFKAPEKSLSMGPQPLVHSQGPPREGRPTWLRYKWCSGQPSDPLSPGLFSEFLKPWPKTTVWARFFGAQRGRLPSTWEQLEAGTQGLIAAGLPILCQVHL